MIPENDQNSKDSKSTNVIENYAFRLGDGSEFAEFDLAHWRFNVYHILGVSRQVTLGYAEAYLLVFFCKHPGEMISRQQLLEQAWGNRVVSQGSLNQAISNLRGLLGDDQKREIIITVPRRGYQLSKNALIDWDEWLIRKQEIINPEQKSALPPRGLTQSNGIIVKKYRAWYKRFIYLLLFVLSFTLIVGLWTSNYYSIFPPYASTYFETPNTKVTLLAENQEVLDDSRKSLQSVLDRIAGLGGGILLINRVHNYIELNCLRGDGTMHTLLVNAVRLQSIDEYHLQRCLK